MNEAASKGTIEDINGPILVAELPGIRNGEQVRIGRLGLSGEVIALSGRRAVIQSYESTEQVRPGEPVEGLGFPLSVELGPGLIGGIFDGVQRPLTLMFEESGDHIPRGVQIAALDREKAWTFEPNEELASGSAVQGGAELGSVQETQLVRHRILVPPDLHGELVELAPAGEYTL
ncbi:MAG: V-type ATP synthase subunit A, partial [Chromatiales bacterium]